MKQPTIERIRDCAYHLADFLLKTDQIEKAIPYIHRLQSLGRDDWQVGIGFLIRHLLQKCQAHQVRQIIHLLDEHCLFDKDNERLFEVEQSLLRHVEIAWNRHGTREQSQAARKHWLDRMAKVEQE